MKFYCLGIFKQTNCAFLIIAKFADILNQQYNMSVLLRFRFFEFGNAIELNLNKLSVPDVNFSDQFTNVRIMRAQNLKG